MLLFALIIIPFLGIMLIFSYESYVFNKKSKDSFGLNEKSDQISDLNKSKTIKTFALAVTVIDLMISLII
jgi:hypothetical protein